MPAGEQLRNRVKTSNTKYEVGFHDFDDLRVGGVKFVTHDGTPVESGEPPLGIGLYAGAVGAEAADAYLQMVFPNGETITLPSEEWVQRLVAYVFAETEGIDITYNEDGTISFVVNQVIPPSNTLSPGQANYVEQLIQQALDKAVKDNTETGITVTYDSTNQTFNFVADMVAPPTPDTKRIYYRYTSSEESASEFVVTDGTWTSSEAAVTGFEFTLGPTTDNDNDYFEILIPNDQQIAKLVNTHFNVDVKAVFTRTSAALNVGTNPKISYALYRLDIGSAGLYVTYNISLEDTSGGEG